MPDKFKDYMGRGKPPAPVETISTFEYGVVGNAGEVDLKTYAYTRTYLESCVDFIAMESRLIQIHIVRRLKDFHEHNAETRITTTRVLYDLDSIRSKITEDTVVFRVDADIILIFANPDSPAVQESKGYHFVPANANIFQFMYNERLVPRELISFNNLIADKGANDYVIKNIEDSID